MTEKPVECGCKVVPRPGKPVMEYLDSSACEVQSLRAQLEERDADIRGYFKIRDAAKSELECVRLAHDCLVAQRHMTIARLGGTVEGGPTCELNFLQRVDELREKEAQLAQEKRQTSEIEAWLRSADREREKFHKQAFELSAQLEEKEREIAKLQAALRIVLNSAVPNHKEHPTMFAAWNIANRALAPETKEQG